MIQHKITMEIVLNKYVTFKVIIQLHITNGLMVYHH